jgi:hypothetical protein
MSICTGVTFFLVASAFPRVFCPPARVSGPDADGVSGGVGRRPIAPHHPKRCEWIGGRLTAGRKRTSRLTPKARAVLHLSDSRAFAVPQHLPAGFYAPTSVPAHAQQHVLQLPTAPHTKQQQQHHSLQPQVGLTSMIMSNVSPSFTRWIAARLPTPFRTVLFRMRST